MTYKLVCDSYNIDVSEIFVNSCKVFTNMFEDLGNKDINEDIPVTNVFNEDDIKKYINFFEELNILNVKTNDNIEISYLDYIIDYVDEFIENYTNKDIDPPHLNRLISIFNKIGEDNIIKFLEIDKFYDNKKIRRGIMLCIAAFVRSVNEYDNIEPYTEFKEREEQVHELVKGIMDTCKLIS